MQFLEEGFVGQVERFGVLPVVMEDLIDAAGDVLVSNLDSKLPTAVETAGREVDGADDGAVSIGENKLGMELDVLELVNFDTSS